MNAEDARKIREDALQEYKKLAELNYVPKVESAIKRAAEEGHSSTSIKLGGVFMDEPVPDKKVVDEVIRILRTRGFEAEEEFGYAHDIGGIIAWYASMLGRTIKIEW